MLLVMLSVAFAAVNVPTNNAALAEAGATFEVTVELTRFATPSVWNNAPPNHALDVLPLSVLFTIVALPSMRMPPPTLPATLPLTVLLSMRTAALKNA